MDTDTTTSSVQTTASSDISSSQNQSSGSDRFLKDGDTYDDLLNKDILELMGFATLTDEKKEELHKKIADAIELRVVVKLMDSLDDEGKKEYEALLDENDGEKINRLLESKGINLEQMTAQEILLMKMELYQDSKIIKQKASEYLAKQNDNSKSGE